MMQSEDGFRDVLNSIQSLNVASKNGDDEQSANIRYSDSGFSSTGGSDMIGDNIFFYDEDSCPSLSSCLNISNNSNNVFNVDDMKTQTERVEIQQNRNSCVDQEMTQIKVNVGIDEDLKMILEMDPSLMDETLDKAFEPSSVNVVDCPKVLGLPPKV
jgi:hypothetical protein